MVTEFILTRLNFIPCFVIVFMWIGGSHESKKTASFSVRPRQILSRLCRFKPVSKGSIRSPFERMNLQKSEASYLDTVVAASPALRPDAYVVWNPLTPSEIAWLQRQSLLVAEAFQKSKHAS